MTFQSTVALNQGFGVPGEPFTDSPSRAAPYNILTSGHPEYNVMGNAFTIVADGATDTPTATAGGTGVFAGILVGPKEQANYGTTGDTLAPTLTVPNNVVGECMIMGEVIVTLPAAANIGDLVTYNTTTGALGSTAPLASFTGVIAVTTGVLTVSALATGGYVAVGSPLSGANVPGGTVITSQLTGTAGSNGTYSTNIITAVASTTMTVPNSPLAVAAANAYVPRATVARYNVAVAGLAVIKLTN